MTDARANQDLTELISDFVQNDVGNYVPADRALRPDIVGMRLFDRPLVAFGSARDSLYAELKRPGVVGPGMLGPEEWVPGAQTVISYFLPFTERVRRANAAPGEEAPPEWLHGRIEGQAFIVRLGGMIVGRLAQLGFPSVCPAADERFRSVFYDKADSGSSFRSNWSERHAGFVNGLGTFGLSRGLITEKGMAGRLGSVITTAAFETTPRRYGGVYEWCSGCGACVARCPVNAISLESGKDHVPCYEVMMESKRRHAPYLGCGKCQVGVPCESARPALAGTVRHSGKHF